MLNTLNKSKLTYLIIAFCLLLLLWWIRINALGLKDKQENYLFGFTYAYVALIGGVNGLFITKFWGGWKSAVGRGLVFFSLGLLGEFFGQTVWSYYNVIAKIAVPYPSLADLGYFSIIPFYSLGMLSLWKAVGAKFSLKSINGIFVAIAIPAVMLGFSYFFFLRYIHDEISLKNVIQIFLDYGYPIGEAISISIALATFFLSKKLLGGKMKMKILFLILALIVQYITDTTFLYQANNNTYYNAGLVDLMYMISFLVMSLGLLSFKNYE